MVSLVKNQFPYKKQSAFNYRHKNIYKLLLNNPKHYFSNLVKNHLNFTALLFCNEWRFDNSLYKNHNANELFKASVQNY
jgi:hypothetical protein